MWVPSIAVWVIASSCLVTVFVLISANSDHIETNSFKRETACNLQRRIDGKCAFLLPGGTSYLQYCAMCRSNKSCVGVSKAAGNKFYLHTNCPGNVTLTCSPGSDSFSLHRKNPCLNNGAWNSSKNYCQCGGGWVGQWCERYAKSCAELVTYGYSKWTEHDVTLQVDGKLSPFKGKCNIFDSTQNTYIMKTFGLLQAQCRSWHDYVYGFFVDKFNFWIGLENMKALNDAGHTVVRLDVGYPIQAWYYQNFSMGNMSDGYRFTYMGEFNYYNNSSYKSCLAPVKGARFSTLDRDQDMDPNKNCAAITEAGWWFKTCDPSCIPMGSTTGRKMEGIANMSTKYYEILFYFEG